MSLAPVYVEVVPEGWEELLNKFTKDLLLAGTTNIYDFAAVYFRRDPSTQDGAAAVPAFNVEVSTKVPATFRGQAIRHHVGPRQYNTNMLPPILKALRETSSTPCTQNNSGVDASRDDERVNMLVEKALAEALEHRFAGRRISLNICRRQSCGRTSTQSPARHTEDRNWSQQPEISRQTAVLASMQRRYSLPIGGGGKGNARRRSTSTRKAEPSQTTTVLPLIKARAIVERRASNSSNSSAGRADTRIISLPSCQPEVNFTRKSPAVILAAEHRRRRRQNKDAAAVSVITSSKVLSSLPSTAVKTAGPETTTDGIPHCQPDPVTVSIRHTDPGLTRPSTYPGQTLPQLNNDTCDPRRATRIPDSTFTAPVEERTSMPFQPQSVTFWTNGDRPSNPMSRAMMSLSVMRPNVHTHSTDNHAGTPDDHAGGVAVRGHVMLGEQVRHDGSGEEDFKDATSKMQIFRGPRGRRVLRGESPDEFEKHPFDESTFLPPLVPHDWEIDGFTPRASPVLHATSSELPPTERHVIASHTFDVSSSSADGNWGIDGSRPPSPNLLPISPALTVAEHHDFATHNIDASANALMNANVGFKGDSHKASSTVSWTHSVAYRLDTHTQQNVNRSHFNERLNHEAHVVTETRTKPIMDSPSVLQRNLYNADGTHHLDLFACFDAVVDRTDPAHIGVLRKPTPPTASRTERKAQLRKKKSVSKPVILASNGDSVAEGYRSTTSAPDAPTNTTSTSTVTVPAVSGLIRIVPPATANAPPANTPIANVSTTKSPSTTHALATEAQTMCTTTTMAPNNSVKLASIKRDFLTTTNDVQENDARSMSAQDITDSRAVKEARAQDPNNETPLTVVVRTESKGGDNCDATSTRISGRTVTSGSPGQSHGLTVTPVPNKTYRTDAAMARIEQTSHVVSERASIELMSTEDGRLSAVQISSSVSRPCADDIRRKAEPHMPLSSTSPQSATSPPPETSPPSETTPPSTTTPPSPISATSNCSTSRVSEQSQLLTLKTLFDTVAKGKDAVVTTAWGFALAANDEVLSDLFDDEELLQIARGGKVIGDDGSDVVRWEDIVHLANDLSASCTAVDRLSRSTAHAENVQLLSKTDAVDAAAPDAAAPEAAAAATADVSAPNAAAAKAAVSTGNAGTGAVAAAAEADAGVQEDVKANPVTERKEQIERDAQTRRVQMRETVETEMAAAATAAAAARAERKKAKAEAKARHDVAAEVKARAEAAALAALVELEMNSATDQADADARTSCHSDDIDAVDSEAPPSSTSPPSPTPLIELPSHAVVMVETINDDGTRLQLPIQIPMGTTAPEETDQSEEDADLADAEAAQALRLALFASEKGTSTALRTHSVLMKWLAFSTKGRQKCSMVSKNASQLDQPDSTDLDINIHDLREIFDILDVNHDNKISVTEYVELVVKHSPYFGFNSVEELGKAFVRMDLDGSGFLSWSEVCKATGIVNPPEPVYDITELRGLFDEVDAKHNGSITISEWSRLVVTRSEMLKGFFKGQTMGALALEFNAMDRNHDGHLTWDDFLFDAGGSVPDELAALKASASATVFSPGLKDSSAVARAKIDVKGPEHKRVGLKELKELYDSMDQDGDNSVTITEWIGELVTHADLLSKCFGGKTLASTAALFHIIDSDHSGTLSWKEVVKAAKKSRASVNEDLERIAANEYMAV